MDWDRKMRETIVPLLAPGLARVVKAIPAELLARTQEIRLRAGFPLRLVVEQGDVLLDRAGQPSEKGGHICTPEELAQTLMLISRNSVYAYEEELRQGFLTIPGGHRIGLAGQASLRNGELTALKNIGSMNIRLARETPGAAEALLPHVIAGERRVFSTLIIAPPRCGKTTVLRDLIRQLSQGVESLGFRGMTVGLVDERSEIAACRDGVATNDLGPRTDVLDGCPKADGILMLIRSMGPGLVATDELGRESDVRAVREALTAGVGVIATVHGRSVAEVAERPQVGGLIAERCFDRYAILSDEPRPGTLTGIFGPEGRELPPDRKGGVRICG